MPLFSSSGSILEQEIEKATQETIVKEDVPVMYEICDRVNATPDGTKEAYKCLVKRLQNSNPRVALLALSLLDVCVMNCGKKFHLEICSRDFTNQVKAVLAKSHPKVQDKLKFLLCKWASNEFKADPQLAIIDNFIQLSKMEGVVFDVQQEPTLDTMEVNSGQRNKHRKTQEDYDLAKAIELSLEESKKKEENTGTASSTGSSLYPSMSKVAAMTSTTTNSTSAGNGSGDNAATLTASKVVAKESRKVRALYDFEAAEENELSFKAGEIIIVLEDRDPNWWKGSNHRGEGLFPSNFVTSDLEAPAEEPAATATSASASAETPTPAPVAQVDEAKIDLLLHMLHDADPTVLERTDADTKMEALQAECALMTPLIDAELEKIDRKHQTLTTLSRRLTDALASYHQLLRQPQMAFVPPMMNMHPQVGAGVPQMPYYPPVPTMAVPPPQGYPGVPMPPAGATLPPGMHVLPGQPPMAGGAPGRPMLQGVQLPPGVQAMPPTLVMPAPYAYPTHPAMNGALPPDAVASMPVVSQAAQPGQ